MRVSLVFVELAGSRCESSGTPGVADRFASWESFQRLRDAIRGEMFALVSSLERKFMAITLYLKFLERLYIAPSVGFCACVLSHFRFLFILRGLLFSIYSF